MQKTLRLLTLLLAFLTIGSSAFGGQYSPAFPGYLATLEDGTPVDAIITMADQVDLEALKTELYAIRADRQTWHEAVVRALQEKATLTQADIIAQLEEMVADGRLEEFKTLWLGNVIIVRGTVEALDELVSRQDVLRVSPDYPIETIQPVSENDDLPIIAGHEIGLQRIRATEAWAMGYTGEGRLVSNIDTGVDGDHSALTDRWAGNDPRYAGHPEWAWLDPFDTHWPLPDDQNGHGTHTMGTICGLSVANADTIGVAFGAQWIAAGAIDRGGGIPRTVADAILSFQWIADPDANPATVWDVPDVCSNSWGVTTGHGYPPCDETFWVVLDGCEAAGVVVVFAAGNEGSEGLRRPADRASTLYMNFSVGAVDGATANMPMADFSSRGPSSCTPDGTPTFKPEVSAPGVNVRSSIPGGGYANFSGTSMACPHVAGVVALIRQANPNLTAEQVKQIMYETATEAPADNIPGEDNNWGMGVVNAEAAVQRALQYLDGWGTLGGIITDQATGLPIQGARIMVLNRPWSTTSRATGQYYIFMPADTVWYTKVEFPPTHLPIFDTITVLENDTIFQNYALEGKVPVVLRASFGNPVHVSYRSFFLKGSWNSDGFWDNTWSAAPIEVKDDGQAPDQTANDGIFTGSVLLARDLVHTYSWAIYSENYGGEAARLQSGANFQILNLTPPNVATLAVNPSGSDNNWMITAFGDNGLNLDLSTHPLDNRPTKWGASTTLDSGVTYTLRFRVMHSTVASYGIGGVGGGNIVFNCIFTGPYDFIFDDRDDTYIIQLTGTEGPPTYVTARSGLDGHIPVSWLRPGMTESQEISMDDGTLANAYYFFTAANLSATMFVPQSYPVTIDSAIIHVLTEGDQYWPWPDGDHQPIGISIFVDDGTGQPATDPVYYTEATATLGEWVRADIPEVLISSGAFWIAMNNVTDLPFPPAPGEGIGLDANTDYPANQWWRQGGIWSLQNSYTGDHMIRAKVFGGAAAFWMGYDSSPAYAINSGIPSTNGASLTAGTSAAGKNDFANRLAYHPNVAPGDTPQPFDTEVLAGYNLYRAITPNPYNGGNIANRVNGTNLIITTGYDDWGGVLDSIVNGITYYYEASAVYEVDSQYIEIGPSNQAVGIATNLPPFAPYNLQGTAVGRTISVNWAFGDSARDLAHFNVFKRLMPHGSTVLVASPTDLNLAFDIPIGEDGVYKVTVTAVDDGTPALESEPSRAVYLAVGHLPPGALSAVSGSEFSVPLRWLLPGSWRSATAGEAPKLDNTPRPLDLSLKGDRGPSNPPMLLNRGGPDAFGYEWVDSDEPDGPAFEWRDITGPGTQIPMSGDDENLGPFPIGFDVSYYGETFNTFNVCSNGFISFTSSDATFSNGPLPSPSAPLNMIAPFWDDLYPPTGGEYWYYSDGSELVVSFINVPHIGGGGPYTFQIVLRSTGTILLQYQTMGFPTNEATIGVQNGDGSIGLQMVFNADYIHDGLAIRIGSGPEGIQPVHFMLYRAATPNVPLDPAHLINGSIPGTETRYTDSDGIVNGVPYYYKLTAVWPDSIESPSSNEASGTPANHQPLAPFNVQGTVFDRTVSLTWSHNDAMGDRDHYSIYKTLMPNGTTTFVGSTPDSAFSFAIPNGEDGVYQVLVTAVDDGIPPMESDPSEEIFLPVGHLPASSLTAINGEEFAVPLTWLPPGAWRAAGSGDVPGNPITSRSAVKQGAEEPQDLDLSHKGEIGPSNPPMILDRGGPDAFGYEWVDSDEPGGPAYQWVDITGDGVQIPMTSDDQNLGPFDIGFDVDFYGQTYNQFYVCSNGWVSFTSTLIYYTNEPLPSPSAPLDMMAPFWDDLYPPTGGEYWYRSSGTELVVSFVNVPHIGQGGPYTFQIVLRRSGTMFFNYQTMGEPTNEATIGIQNYDGSIGLQVVYNAAYLHDQMTIKLSAGSEGFQPVHYKLYRATTPNVPTDPAHLRDGSIPGALTAYRDFGGMQNGVTYYYKLTAVWPDSIESPPTNEAAGTPANHPPDIPFGLTGVVNGRNVTLDWSFTNTMGDWANFKVYKKVIPSGDYVLAGTFTDSSAVINIPLGQDGMYAFAVAAADNGTPPLESDRSTPIYLPVGNLPPLNLVGTSDQEGYVPLHWSAPGMLPRTTISYDDGTLGNAYYFFSPTNLSATMFVPSAYPTTLDSVMVHVLTEGDQYWPWPDGEHQPIGISVFLDDGNGQPAVDPVASIEATAQLGQWITADIEDVIITSGNFWIAMNNITDLPFPPAPGEGIGLDANTDYPANQWWRQGDIWSLQSSYSGDHMIRAVIIDNGMRITLSEKAPSTRLALAMQETSSADDMTASVGGANSVRLPVSRLSGGGNDVVRPLDTEDMVGYSIYRHTAPNVPVDAAHRIRNYTAQGLGTAYNDSSVTNGTTYYYVVTAVYNNPPIEESPASNEISATPRMGARMVATPLSFNVTGQAGQITTSNLNISNPGGLQLDYAIVPNTSLRSAAPQLIVNNSSFDAAGLNINHEVYDKSEPVDEPSNPPMLLDRGGPDAFGYIWIDSDENGGPIYGWIDITGDGIQIPMTGDDENLGPYDVGFNFPYYGVAFNSFYVCSNGFVSFSSAAAPYTNTPLPDFTAPTDMLAAFWDDLYPPTGGQYWYRATASELVISFIGVPHIGNGGNYTFQIILRPNGSITYQYDFMTGPTNEGTIGIQNGDGSIGLTVAFNQDYVHDGLAIRFTASWLSTIPAGGSILPGANQNVSVVFDATSLDAGTYSGSLLITGADMNRPVTPITIPVTFHVQSVGVDDGAADLPKEFALAQNYPNPFNPSTEIKFDLPTRAFVNLQVFNVLGQKVKTLINSEQDAGYRSIVWNGTDEGGKQIASGTYFYILKVGGNTFTKKMTMIK